MKLFYKTADDFFYGDHRLFSLPQAHGTVHTGIDGSTSSFGFAYTNKDHSNPVVMMFIREEESHDRFFSLLFPMIQNVLHRTEVETATYEKTPDDFDSPTHSVKVMKNTERAVGNFLSNGNFINMKHKFNIYSIFPNSWKAYLVNTDPDSNYRKTDKRQNAADILTTLKLESNHWLKEADEVSGHSYDAFEALGICSYGSRFIHRGVFTATYRNFKKRRPLQVLFKETTWDTFVQDAKEFKALLGEPPMALMVPNQHHSFMENLYALDADDRVNIMVVSPADNRDLHMYYKFITGVENLLMLSVTRREIAAGQLGAIYI